MKTDPASLDNLRDIAEPPPVPWWPPAPGWWIVASVLAIAAVVAAIVTWRRWRANAYRRAALRELQSARNVTQVAAILKRAALVAYPRQDVASLSGMAWCDWLEKTGPVQVSPPVAESLASGVFGDKPQESNSAVTEFARSWISEHVVSDNIADRGGASR